ncbi:MAG: hypothetical protein LBN09_02795 [Clostridioides sp.]|jgi:RNA polymerase sigma-70 factor (ECF subfamily)|nr:hypothetical protein [Clostridioides sp.]
MKITEENFIAELKRRNEKALYYVIDEYGWIIKSTARNQLYNLLSYQEECLMEKDLIVLDGDRLVTSTTFRDEKNGFEGMHFACNI